MDGADDDLAALGPGIHVITEPHPLKRARHVALSLGADLCATAPQAEAALAARKGFAGLSEDALARLSGLAGRLARADGMVATTTARAVDRVSQRLAATGTALVVHPDTIRLRSQAVVDAREKQLVAAAALAEHDRKVEEERSVAAARLATVPDLEPEVEHADPRLPVVRRGPSSAVLLGLLALVLAVGLLVFALDLLPLWLALLPTFVGSLVLLRLLKPARAAAPEAAADDDHVAASELLRSVAAATDDAFGAQRPRPAEAAQRKLLAMDADRALEEVRVAERAWEELAGEGVDVLEVDDVVRRFDPHHLDAVAVAGQTVSVRAASAVRDRWLAEWDAAWADLQGGSPAVDDAPGAVRELWAAYRRAVVLVGPAVELAQALAAVAPNTTIVVLEGGEDDGG